LKRSCYKGGFPIWPQIEEFPSVLKETIKDIKEEF